MKDMKITLITFSVILCLILVADLITVGHSVPFLVGILLYIVIKNEIKKMVNEFNESNEFDKN